MRTRPQTIGVALNDNPVGILAWVGEKYIEGAHPSKLDQPDNPKDARDDIFWKAIKLRLQRLVQKLHGPTHQNIPFLQ